MPECEEAYTNREEKEETEMKVLKENHRFCKPLYGCHRNTDGSGCIICTVNCKLYQNKLCKHVTWNCNVWYGIDSQTWRL